VKYGPFLPIIVLVVFGALIYLGSNNVSSNKGTQEKLKPTDETWTGTRVHDNKPESDLDIISPNGEHFKLSLYAGGVPYQERSQAESNKQDNERRWKYSWEIHRYPIDFETDLGAWAGFRVSTETIDRSKSETGFDIGLRYSPTRLMYGVISPDLLISPRQAGIGVSVYLPAQTVSYPFNKLGIGIGYLADYNGGSGWTPYASFSTRF
jgi:hypothetical protein